jgi:hypothetical protein
MLAYLVIGFHVLVIVSQVVTNKARQYIRKLEAFKRNVRRLKV